MPPLTDRLSDGIDALADLSGRAFWAAWDSSGKALRKVIGSRNERLLKTILPAVQAINALEPGMKALSDDALRGKTAGFKARLAERLQGVQPPPRDTPAEGRAAYRQKVQAALDEILPEAYAVVREVSRRVNKVENDDPACLEPTPLPAPPRQLKLL